MKSTNQVTIAIPGEKRNEKQVKRFLLAQGLMNESDANQDIFPITGTSSRFVTLRTQEAIRYMESGIIDGVINGEDLIANNMLQRRFSPIKERSSIKGYDFYDSYCGAKWIVKDKRFLTLFVLDDNNPTRLKFLYRPEDSEKTLEELINMGKILASYPYLTAMILQEKFGKSDITNMIVPDGKIEALLKLGIGKSAVDVVDTGNSARKNSILIGETLFESFPVGVFPEKNIVENPELKSVVDRLTEASNKAYYNSPNYRVRYPRG